MKTLIEDIFNQDLIRLVISNPRNNQVSYRKMTLRKISKLEKFTYQLECFTDKQAFHFNYDKNQAMAEVQKYLETEFRQCDAFCRNKNYLIKISKKGKVLVHTQSTENKEIAQNHNRQKQYLLAEGVFIEPLYDLGILTKDGKVVHSMYDKFKQINRYIEMIDDVISSDTKSLSIIDFGCGKSYLTFIVYYYLHTVRNIDVHMIGLDLKADVIQKCNDIAKKYNYTNLKFEIGNINGYTCNQAIDMVISLHACDTATDFALFNAISWQARIIFAVPCCQHELNQQIKTHDLSLVTRYGLIQERTAALFTDAIRANLLETMGYDTQILEFIDISHSPKNILIRAIKNDKKKLTSRHNSLKEVNAVLDTFSIKPTLYQLLQDKLNAFDELVISEQISMP